MDDRAETELLRAVREAAGSVDRGDVDGALALAARLDLPNPGHGRTRVVWRALSLLGGCDLQLARAVEPHLDALAILDQAGVEPPAGARLGVFAAEAPHTRLEARADGDSWRLDGVKPWCSLADRLSHGLVTAWVDEERRGLFLVPLDGAEVDTTPGAWEARGLPDIVSTSVAFEGASAVPVGAPGWYLERDGFAWGGIGVAAVWYGAARALGARLARASARREPDQVALMHLGAVDTALHLAGIALDAAADDVDAGRAGGDAGAVLAGRVRQAVADAAELTLRTTDHALGPAPLVAEAEHAARVADLHLYLRQHHGERDLAAAGRRVLDAGLLDPTHEEIA